MNGVWEDPFNHQGVGQFTNVPPKPWILHPNEGIPLNGQSFKAAHMALIPVSTPGPHVDHRGHVIVWDQNERTEDPTNLQRWAIVDPVGEQFWNYELTLPGMNAPSPTANLDTDGDIFCSGHSWTEDGLLFVAGGSIYKDMVDHIDLILGARLVYLWDPRGYASTSPPSDHGWHLKSPLAQSRYYPSATLLGDGKVMVTGGLDDVANYGPTTWPSTYEVGKPDLDPAVAIDWDDDGQQTPTRIYQGVVESNGSHLQWYPRMHLLTTSTVMGPAGQNTATGDVFYAGFGAKNARLLHNPLTPAAPPWHYAVGNHPTQPPAIWAATYRHYNSSVLLPIDLNVGVSTLNRVMRMGGHQGGFYFDVTNPVATAEICNAGISGSGGDWLPTAPMNRARIYHTAVLLPDASVFVLGGQDASGNPILRGEIYKNGTWTDTAPLNSPRDYHTGAILLANGQVFVGGGEHRSVDYERYSPPYLFKGPRPVITGWSSQVFYDTTTDITFGWSGVGPDTYVDKVVLMRPGSITHHSDSDQRYVALKRDTEAQLPLGQIRVFLPANSKYAPKGHYMLFLVSQDGVPSVAKWVELK